MKYIALIAHDGKKQELVSFAKQFQKFFNQVPILATQTTGSRLAEVGIDVETVASGPKGGDAQIAAKVTEGEVAGVIFFATPWANIRTNRTSTCCFGCATCTTFPWRRTQPQLS